MKVFVTAFSHLTSIGTSTEKVLDNLMHKKSGVTESTFDQYGTFNTGSIDYSNEELKEIYRVKGNYSRTALLGIGGIKELGEPLNRVRDSQVSSCLISGTSVGGMDLLESDLFSYLNDRPFSAKSFSNHASGVVTHQMMKETMAFDMIDTISTACSSAANAILQGGNFLKNGLYDCAVVGGTDALSIFTISGFNSLNIYDTEFCRPFDNSRAGLNLGEGSAYLLLETEESMLKTGNTPLVELKGWCNASDAYHQTASSPEGIGATTAMRTALEMAQISADDIDYVNAHGTGTPNNDLTESTALINVFKNAIPAFSSTKTYTGHTLAACGGIEAGFAIHAIQKGLVFPNLNFVASIEETGLTPNTELLEGQDIRYVLSNSFGFGGNNTSLIFGKVE
jgi:3-oxoacyl-(acyl-carrier-protein) synthase